MKKICALIALLLFGFVFVACDKIPTPTPEPGDVPGQNDGDEGGNNGGEKNPTSDPAITLPAQTLEINVGEKLDLTAGVKALGYFNDDLSSKIKINHNIPVDGQGCVTTAGTYNVRYSLEIDGAVVAQVFRTVVVIYVRPVTDDIIANGDFESGSVDPFTLGLFDGGAAKLSVVEKDGSKALKVEITGVSWQQASPRVEQAIKLDASKIYEVKFKAAADVARTLHVQVGQLLPADPWFVNLDPTARYFDLTTTMTEYSFRFKPAQVEAVMDELLLLLELGTMPKGADASVATNVYFDDIAIVEVDSLGEDKTAPTISVTGKAKYFVGEGFDALGCVSVTDDQDENPTVAVVEAESNLPVVADGKLTTEGSYKVVYTATDAAGNTAKMTYEFEVVAPASAGTELIVNNDFSQGNDTGFEGWLSWAEAGIHGTAADGKATLTVNNSASTETWTNQFKQEHLQLQAGKEYVLKVTIKSSVARSVIVAIQNANWWNMHVEQKVALEAGVEQTLELPFTAVECSDNVMFFIALGNVDGTCPDTHTVEVSGLSLKEKASSNLFKNPDFSDQTVEAEGFGSWIAYGHNNGECKLTWEVVDGKVVLTVNNANATDTWHNQFKQNGLPLIEGKTYTLKVTLKSSVDRQVVVAIQNDQWWNMHTEATLDLVAGEAYEYSVDFTAVATSDNVMFFVALGKVGGVLADDHTVEISGLSLVETGGTDEPIVDPNPTPTPTPIQPELDPNKLFGTPNSEIVVGSSAKRGAAEATTEQFHVFLNDQGWDGGATTGSATLVDGVLTVNTEVGTNPPFWGAQVMYNTQELAAGSYTVSFKLNSPVAGTIKFNGQETYVIAVGENTLTADITLGAPSAYFFEVILGSVAGGHLGSGTYVFSDFSIVKK